jgi:hypothetical protein
VHDGHRSEDLDCCVVVDLDLTVASAAEQPAVAMIGILINADVCDDDKFGDCAFHFRDGLRYGAMRVKRARPTRVLCLWEAEEENTAEAVPRRLSSRRRRS